MIGIEEQQEQDYAKSKGKYLETVSLLIEGGDDDHFDEREILFKIISATSVFMDNYPRGES